MEFSNLPGFYRFFLGDLEIVVLSDGTATVYTEKMMLNATSGEVSYYLRESYAEADYEASINAFLFRSGGQLILIDTGAGDLMGPTAGHLTESLRAAGYEPGDIDVVLLTHIHGDHSGGLMDNGALAFPNATLYVNQRDFDYWLSEEQMNGVPPARQQSFRNAKAKVGPWKEAGRVKTFLEDLELIPGVFSWAQPGHTPGHTYFTIKNGRHKIVFCADIVHVAEIQLANPDIAITLDVDPQAAVIKRKEFLKLAAEEGFWLAADHISFPGIGHVRPRGNGYFWIPNKFSVRAEINI